MSDYSNKEMLNSDIATCRLPLVKTKEDENQAITFAFSGVFNDKNCNDLYCMYEDRCNVLVIAMLGSSILPNTDVVLIKFSHQLIYNCGNFVKPIWEFNAHLFAINDGLTICIDKAVLESGTKARTVLRDNTPFGIKPMLPLLRAKVFDTAELLSNIVRNYLGRKVYALPYISVHANYKFHGIVNLKWELNAHIVATKHGIPFLTDKVVS